MTLSIGKYDILKMSILETFTKNYFLTSSYVCCWRHVTPSHWALHFIFCPPCGLWWWLLVLWDEMSPGPKLVTDPLLQTQHLVTTLASHHSRGNLCLYVVLSLSHGINSRQGCSNSPHSIDITMSRLSSLSRDQFSTVALWCRGPSRPGTRHRDGSWAT